ncbi:MULTISPECIES: hypothetical protein [unclassified Pseudomonas]|uniref:hypothetical protein n=1 Tax=unclassified Pseudomonas TaxID=196821 RepID=UPI000A1F64FC|nr:MULTISPECIES: hypothetical protein [unclassified Pseudomonas]MDI2145978.1 hypothetical protein [Pseudomonas sp. ITA]
MDFLRFLAFVAAWGFMWRWVVKNRGSWNLIIGNLIGAAGGFIVGLVVFSISLSLFPSAHEPKSQSAPEVVDQEPAIAQVPTPAIAPTPDTTQKTSPAESALLPNYRARAVKSISENLILTELEETSLPLIEAKRQAAGNGADADRSYMAVLMCTPPMQSALRFPSTQHVKGPAFKATRLKDQNYKVTGVFEADNMLGKAVTYDYSCSVQAVPGKDGDTQWNLQDLSLTQKAL